MLREGPLTEASAGGEERAGFRSAAAWYLAGDAVTADAAGLLLREPGDHAVELGAWAEAGTAGPGTIAALEDEVARVMAAYGSSAAGPLILRALYACQRASGLLREHQRLRHAQGLYVVTARCCAFLAVALGDFGRLPEGAAYARTALTLAEESGDPGVIALACSALSKVAFWDGHRQRSADLAARGLATARASDPLRVLLACQQADASLVPAAGEALALAAVAREETAGSSDTDGGLFSCGGVRAGYAATLGLRQGSLAAVLGAVAAAEAAIRDGEQAPYGSLAQVRLVPPLADVRLELVQLRFPAHAGQQLVGAGGPGAPLHGPAVQAGGAADRGLRLPGAEPLADLGVAFPGAPGRLPFPAAHVQRPVRHGRRVLIAVVCGGGLLLQAAAVPGRRLLGVFRQVVPQVPAIGDLDRARRAVTGSL